MWMTSPTVNAASQKIAVPMPMFFFPLEIGPYPPATTLPLKAVPFRTHASECTSGSIDVSATLRRSNPCARVSRTPDIFFN